jgi:hypothetical protein
MARLLREAGADARLIPIRPLTRTRNPLRLAADLSNLATASWALSALARRQGIRLIHATKTEIAFHAALAGLLSRRPVVWQVRSRVSRFGLSGRLLAALSDRIICITQGLEPPFREAMPWAAAAWTSARNWRLSGGNAARLPYLARGIFLLRFSR